MKKMYLKRKIKIKKRKIILLLIILIVISIIYMFRLFNDKSSKYIKEYTEIETDKLITKIINSSVNKLISETDIIDNLVIIENNNVSISSKKVNELIYITASKVKENLKNIEDEKEYIKINIPSGVIVDNVILSNLFPSIPVKLYVLGDLVCKLNTDLKEYGINNALLNLSIDVTVSVKIIYPFTSSKKEVKVSIPILTKIIEGTVPSYYFSSM